MQSFVSILTFYNNAAERNFHQLSSIYRDKNVLEKAIENLIREHLNSGSVQGKKILIKPNWVKHSSFPEDEFCLRTHDNFTLAVLETFLKMRPAHIVIGDSPIQLTNWNKMLSSTFYSDIISLSARYNVPVSVIDFRRRKYSMKENSPLTEIRPLSEYVIFDLGKASMLEPITSQGRTKFRVTNYDPDRMQKAHAPGVHKYCIAKEFFDADIVISLPKIKTHQKTGITGALKNLVGINGDKDFLPHHRIGGTKRGGDCYPGGSYLRYWSEMALDEANRRQGRRSFWYWQKLSSILWRLSMPGPEHRIDAGWCGNDTTWRMVLDLNRIAEYGRADGTLAQDKQRQIYSLCDGIIAGQGDGPLRPEPLPLGIISFSNDSALNDKAMALLMGFDPRKLPLLKNSNPTGGSDTITFNGKKIHLSDLNAYALKALPPKGWINYIDNGR